MPNLTVGFLVGAMLGLMPVVLFAAAGGTSSGGGAGETGDGTGARACTTDEWTQYCGGTNLTGVNCTYQNNRGTCSCSDSSLTFIRGQGCMASATTCSQGQYLRGGGPGGLTTCVKCPTDTINGFSTTTVGAGPNTITSCYATAGQSATDDTGTWTYNSDCYYSN